MPTSGRHFELEAAEPKVFLSGFFSAHTIPEANFAQPKQTNKQTNKHSNKWKTKSVNKPLQRRIVIPNIVFFPWIFQIFAVSPCIDRLWSGRNCNFIRKRFPDTREYLSMWKLHQEVYNQSDAAKLTWRSSNRFHFHALVADHVYLTKILIGSCSV